jgi:MFS family permease
MDMTAGRRPETLTRTRWNDVGLLLFAGICAAMQVGKVPPALPVLQADLRFGLLAAGWVISMFSIIGALSGSALGSIADRFGERRITVCGLLVMAAASGLGATSHSAVGLIVGRAIEGMAFVIVVISIPGLIVASAAEAHRRFVPSLWGVYMPTGMALALIVTPLLIAQWGWRTVWQLNGVLLLVPAIALALIKPAAVRHELRSALTLAALKRTLSHRRAQLLALTFTGYTFQHLSVLGFLPTILHEEGIDTHTAGLMTAGAVIANALGNLATSWLLAHHVPAWRMMVFAALMMGLTSFGIFAESLPPLVRYAMTVAFSGFGGLLPASIFAMLPAIARETNTGATMQGLVVQASHIGQLLGPPAIAAVAAWAGGWHLSPLALGPAALISIIAALGLRASRPT